MTRTRAGAARPTPGSGGAAVDVVDRLARALGRVVVVDVANLEKLVAANPGIILDAEGRAATLHQSVTAAVNTGATATLPAAGAGLFHYIVAIELVKLYSVLGVAAGAGNIITSTNLPGNPAWTTEQNAGPAGTVARVIDYRSVTALKSLVANTATTFVAPAQLQTIWRWNVSYFTGL